MRKVLLVVALLAVALVATPASAFTTDANALPGGPLVGKYSNFSDLYYPSGSTIASDQGGGTAGPNGFAQLYGATIADLIAGEGTLENRAIFNTSSINLPSTVPAWLPVSQQLTGLFYNLTLIGVSGNASNLQLDFGPGTRNPLTSGPGLAGAPVGSGGVINVYLQGGTTNFNADPNSGGSLTVFPVATATVNGNPPVSNNTWGPGAWVEGSGVADSYAGASSGGLWLSGEFVPFADVTGVNAGLYTAGTVFSETLNLGTGNGSAIGYIHLVDGSYYPDVGKGDLGLGAYVDMVIGADEYTPGQDGAGNLTATANFNGTGYWPIDSDDPVNFDVIGIPEPATLSLLGFGLVGLLIRRRK